MPCGLTGVRASHASGGSLHATVAGPAIAPGPRMRLVVVALLGIALTACAADRCDSILDCDLYSAVCREGHCVPLVRCDTSADCFDDEYCTTARTCETTRRCDGPSGCSDQTVCTGGGGSPPICRVQSYACDDRGACVPSS